MKTVRLLSFVLLVAFGGVLAADLVRLGSDVVPTAEAVSLTADPRSDDYSGSVVVDLQVKKATPTFRFHAEDMTLASLKLTKGNKAVDVTHAKGEDGTVLVTAAKPLQPGKYTLSIDFTNKYNRQAVGLYKMTVKDGTPYLFTQFEAIDARRAFPCWDEPGFKIPYELTLNIPEQYDAVSNTTVASESKSGGRKVIRFARTKPLPSYLIAVAVGEFESTPIEGMSVPGRVIAPKGQGRLTKLAAEITPPLLAALEKYFGSKHPFEKVDLIAVPEYWAGAMENPGAITYRDTVLLLDPAVATPAQRQNLIRVTAHELAHMWFGDLVTMEWWDDLWLNESFADWMGDKITDQVHPELGHAITEDVQNAVWRHRHVTCGKTRVWKNARADVRCVEQTGLIHSARSKHGGWVSGARVQETPVKRVEHAVPDRDEHVAMAFHRKRIVQGPQHRTGIEEVGRPVQAMMPDGLNHAR